MEMEQLGLKLLSTWGGQTGTTGGRLACYATMPGPYIFILIFKAKRLVRSQCALTGRGLGGRSFYISFEPTRAVDESVFLEL